MSLYQHPPLEQDKQAGPQVRRPYRRKLLVGAGVYLGLNLAYFLLTTTSPYSLVPWLGQVVWILFCLFCLGVWLFLLIGVGLLLIKLVRKEPKRKGLYSLLGVLAYVFFALGMFYALFLFSLVALLSTAFNSSWDRYEEKGEIYYEQRVWKESDRCLTMRQENLIFAYSLGTGYCHRETETYYLTDDPETQADPSALPTEFESLNQEPQPLTEPQLLDTGERVLVEEERLSYINQQHGLGALVVGSNQVYSATYQASEGVWQLGGEINSSIGAHDLEVCGMLRLPAENMIAYCQADERGARIYTTADQGTTWHPVETGLPPEASYLLDAYQEEKGLYVLELGYPAWVNSSVTSKLTSPDGITWTKK